MASTVKDPIKEIMKSTLLQYFPTLNEPKSPSTTVDWCKNSVDNQASSSTRKPFKPVVAMSKTSQNESKKRKPSATKLAKEKQKPKVPLVELNSESSDDDQPIKKIIEKNLNIPTVYVKMLSPGTVKAFVNPVKGVVTIEDSSDDEPIAKKFSPASSSTTSSNGENKISQVAKSTTTPKKKTKTVQMKDDNGKKLSQTKKTPASSSIDGGPKKQSTLEKVMVKKVLGTKNSTNNAKKRNTPPKLDDSSLEDSLPLAKISKILSTNAERNITPPKLKQQGASSPSKFLSPSKAREMKFKRLEMLMKVADSAKATRNEKRNYRRYLATVSMTPSIQVSDVEKIKNENLKKAVLFAMEKNKTKNMTEEERKEYQRKKNSEAQVARKLVHESANAKIEDSELSAQDLPVPKKVQLPDRLASNCFGDVLMVVEFMKTFAKFLEVPEKNFEISQESFVKALTSGKLGFSYLGKLLCLIIKKLLQEISPSELGIKTDEIDVNIHTVPELIRVMMTKRESKVDEDDVDSNVSFDDKKEISLFEQLAHVELYDLSAETILEMFVALVHQFFQTSFFEDFLNEREKALTEAWREKTDAAIDLKKYRSLHAEETGENESKPQPSENDSTQLQPAESKNELNSSKSLSITHFYGKAMNEEKNENNDVISVDSDKDDVDDMIFKVKHRRTLALEEKRKKEEQERILREKLKKEDELNSRVTRYETAAKRVAKLTRQVKAFIRREPLGRDRFHSRYWFFADCSPCLFVEKGWSSFTGIKPTSLSSSPKKSAFARSETTFPPIEDNCWFFYDNVADLESLISKLNPKGIRESRLLERLQKDKTEILTTLSAENKEVATFIDDGEIQQIEFLRNEVSSAGQKVYTGALCSTWDFETWKNRLNNAETKSEMAMCLLELQHSVRPTLLRGMMAVKKSFVFNEEDDEKKLTEEELQSQEEARRTKLIENWKDAVQDCDTWSRLTVLFYMFNNCVMWERSVENARCSKCHKNKNDDKVILCEMCNAGYHIYCLRPPLKKVPGSDWYCEQCRPPSARTRRRAKEEREESEEEKDTAVEAEHDDVCARCNVGPSGEEEDELILCATCPAAFHKGCHEPPLRYSPRVGWRCCQCTRGIIVKRILRKKRR